MAVGSMPASALAEAGAEGAAGEGAAAWVLRAARVLGAPPPPPLVLSGHAAYLTPY